MNQLFYLVVFVLFLPLIFSFWVQGVLSVAAMFDPFALAWFLLGLSGALVIELLLQGAVSDFIDLSVHELTHAFSGAFFLKGTGYVWADSRVGGETGLTGGNPFVYLAPYYLPLLTIPLLVAKVLFAGKGATLNNMLDLLIGLTLGFHYAVHVKQFLIPQDDVERVGHFVAVGVTYTFMMIFFVIAVAVVTGNYSQIAGFFANAFAQAPGYYGAVVDWLRGLAL